MTTTEAPATLEEEIARLIQRGPTCTTCWGASQYDGWTLGDSPLGRRRGSCPAGCEFGYAAIDEARADLMTHLIMCLVDRYRPSPEGVRPIDANADPVGRRHPETARAVSLRLADGTKRRKVYDYISTRITGATADEVAEHFGWGHQSASAVVSTLKRDGWLKVLRAPSDQTPIRRPTRSGNQADVMEVAR